MSAPISVATFFRYCRRSISAIRPWVLTGNDQDFYIYYGSGDLSEKSNASAVWSNGYAAAWHLESTSSLGDSTGNGNTLTNNGPVNSTGAIGGGLDFDGSSAIMSCSAFSNIATGGTFSLSAWVKRDTRDGDSDRKISDNL